jgi:hypothetical protein
MHEELAALLRHALIEHCLLAELRGGEAPEIDLRQEAALRSEVAEHEERRDEVVLAIELERPREDPELHGFERLQGAIQAAAGGVT